jgi:nucleoside-diphosphate-sugar epimerase
MSKLVFGCGYLGLRVARRWRDAGETVYAVTRSVERSQALQTQGLIPIIADVSKPVTLRELPAVTSVLYAVGFDRSSGASTGQVYVDGFRSVLDALPASVARLVYVSSTGVFGQQDGKWVDESSLCQPTRPTGQACLDAERTLQRHALGPRSVILRLAGIYGPQRVPWMKEIVAGTPVAADEDGHLNLIHVDDAAKVVLAADHAAATPDRYLVSDGNPVPRGQYCRYLARLIHAPEVRFQSPSPASRTTRHASSSKRVRNARMVRQLGVSLDYPTYQEGLASIVAERP